MLYQTYNYCFGISTCLVKPTSFCMDSYFKLLKICYQNIMLYIYIPDKNSLVACSSTFFLNMLLMNMNMNMNIFCEVEDF